MSLTQWPNQTYSLSCLTDLLQPDKRFIEPETIILDNFYGLDVIYLRAIFSKKKQKKYIFK